MLKLHQHFAAPSFAPAEIPKEKHSDEGEYEPLPGPIPKLYCAVSVPDTSEYQSDPQQ